MKVQPSLLLLLSLPFSTCSAYLSTPVTVNSQPTNPLPNANHIFNALNSALRQWGSSWNHNGMSVFRATVPAKVQLYHGRKDQEVVKGMEWLAFEAEHAMMFARDIGPPPGDGRGGGGRPGSGPGRDRKGEGKGVGDGAKEEKWEYDSHNGQRVINEANKNDLGSFPPVEHPELRRRSGHKHPPTDNGKDQDRDHTGYLHHYRTLHDLNLLYVDGQSAGKTSKGTVDLQDYLLRRKSPGKSDSPFDDMDRAIDLCNLTRTIWKGKVDGFIRMECGFEILLCEFEGNVGHERTQTVRDEWVLRSDKKMEKLLIETGFRVYKAVSDRFWGIGENRAEVYFEDLVTAYSKEELDLFERVAETGEMLPRLRNASDRVLEDLKSEVTRMVQKPIEKNVVDWQKVSDMYVQRYASPLQALLLPDLEVEDFRRQLELLMWVFVSDVPKGDVIEASPTVDKVARRCANQFLPGQWNESLAGRAVQSVSSRLCDTLTDLLFDLISVVGNLGDHESDKYAMARQEIERLVSWLDWPIWRYCSPGCAVNEVCVLPIWPITHGIEDRKKPNCKNASALAYGRARGFNETYWHTPGDGNGPPRKPNEGKPPKGHRAPKLLE